MMGKILWFSGSLDRWDALALLGLAMVAVGVGWIYPPAGVIVAGLGTMGCAILGALTRRR